MRSNFRNDWYVSQEWFDLEQKEIFSKYWIFACLKFMVDEPNRFVTREIAGVPIVIQNFDGELRAFRNICLHRQHRLQSEDFGTRRLVCHYHGWRYNSDGGLASVPLEDVYYSLDAKESCARLEGFHLRVIGQYVFINLDPNPLPIEKQFGPSLIADLESTSESFGREVLISKIVCNFNWKLIYETLRDSIHPRFIHLKTLTKDVQCDPDPIPSGYEAIPSTVPDLQDLSGGGLSHRFTHDITPAYAPKVERWGDDDGYYEWRLFPNTHPVTPNGGYMFCVEHHVPISPSKTEVIFYFVAPKAKGALPASTFWEHMRGSKEVLDEDHLAAEEVQAVIGRGGPAAPILAAGESSIALLQNWFAANLRNKL